MNETPHPLRVRATTTLSPVPSGRRARRISSSSWPSISSVGTFNGAKLVGQGFEVAAEFHAAIARPEELVVYKQRVGAFSENELHLILRARRIENLVFFGISTSGIVLSTLRRAFDLDFHCIVLKDACYDPDSEVHRVLTEKVFPRQATVLTVDAFIAEQGAD